MRKLRSRSDQGFTLAELLIAVAITGLIAVLIGRTITTSTNNLAGTYDNAAAAQQAIRFNSLIRYDFAGASDVTVFPSTAPDASTASAICWSRSAGTNLTIGANDWLWNLGTGTQAASSVMRALVTLSILQPDRTSDISTWWNARTSFVGYEIRRETGGADRDFELWRVQCDGGYNFLSAERVVRLGSNVSSFVSGDSFLYCSGSSIVTSTNTPSAGYQFSVNTVGDILPTPAPQAIRALNINQPTQVVVGTVGTVNRIAGTVTMTSPQPSPTSGWSPQTVSKWVLARPCVTLAGIKRKNAAFLAVIPYSGTKDSIDTSTLVVLRSKLN